jgi:hypothetical protein
MNICTKAWIVLLFFGLVPFFVLSEDFTYKWSFKVDPIDDKVLASIRATIDDRSGYPSDNALLCFDTTKDSAKVWIMAVAGFEFDGPIKAVVRFDKDQAIIQPWNANQLWINPIDVEGWDSSMPFIYQVSRASTVAIRVSNDAGYTRTMVFDVHTLLRDSMPYRDLVAWFKFLPNK